MSLSIFLKRNKYLLPIFIIILSVFLGLYLTRPKKNQDESDKRDHIKMGKETKPIEEHKKSLGTWAKVGIGLGVVVFLMIISDIVRIHRNIRIDKEDELKGFKHWDGSTRNTFFELFQKRFLRAFRKVVPPNKRLLRKKLERFWDNIESSNKTVYNRFVFDNYLKQEFGEEWLSLFKDRYADQYIMMYNNYKNPRVSNPMSGVKF